MSPEWLRTVALEIYCRALLIELEELRAEVRCMRGELDCQRRLDAGARDIKQPGTVLRLN